MWITDDVASLANGLKKLASRFLNEEVIKKKVENAIGGSRASKKLAFENAR